MNYADYWVNTYIIPSSIVTNHKPCRRCIILAAAASNGVFCHESGWVWDQVHTLTGVNGRPRDREHMRRESALRATSNRQVRQAF